MLKKQIIPIVRAFQSALPRGERQQIGGSPDEDRNISIHAPTRGATASSIQYLDLGSISIHAPTRGATRKQVRPLLEPRDFNPRSHEGSDVLTRTIYLYFPEFQSTLPRGERPFPVTNQSRLTLFQSTLPRGERPPAPETSSVIASFQSTLPRGERRRCCN